MIWNLTFLKTRSVCVSGRGEKTPKQPKKHVFCSSFKVSATLHSSIVRDFTNCRCHLVSFTIEAVIQNKGSAF